MGYLRWKRKDRSEAGTISYGETIASHCSIYIYHIELQNFFGLVFTMCLPYSLFLNGNVYYDFSSSWLTIVRWDMRER